MRTRILTHVIVIVSGRPVLEKTWPSWAAYWWTRRRERSVSIVLVALLSLHPIYCNCVSFRILLVLRILRHYQDPSVLTHIVNPTPAPTYRLGGAKPQRTSPCNTPTSPETCWYHRDSWRILALLRLHSDWLVSYVTMVVVNCIFYVLVFLVFIFIFIFTQNWFLSLDEYFYSIQFLYANIY